MNNKRKLADLSAGRDNNLNLVRLFASFMVMYMHSFALCIADQSKDIMYTLTFHKALSGQVAVDIFFVISGFLIYRSYDRKTNVGKYLKARFLRIWPLLALFILSTAYIIGPIITTMSREEYFQHKQYEYLTNLFFAASHTRLPGVFYNHIVIDINGSIWTLRYEVICYIFVLMMLPIIRRYKKSIFIMIGFFAALYLFMSYGWAADSLAFVSKDIILNIGRLTMMFCIGAFYYLYQDKIPICWQMLLASIVCLVAASYFIDYEIAFALFGSYIVIYIGFQDWKIARLYDKVGDLSYGVYVISFLVQQLVVDAMGVSPDGYEALRMDPYVNLGLSLLIVLPIAFISWHCFEKQLLKLK